MNLTPSQQRAVETDSREVLVIAGAGSGKTRVLVERIKFLIHERGFSPADFLVLTFTRKAAAEMLDRLCDSCVDGGDFDDMRGMLIGTFHSVALKILRADGDKLGYDAQHITVIDPDDANMLLKQVCRDLGYLTGGGKWKGGLSFKTVKRNLECEYTGQVMPPDTKAVHDAKSVCREYWVRLKNLNSLDFGLILWQCTCLLNGHPDVLARYQARIEHVLVDELQDEDEVQFNLHHHFAPPATFFGVGDRRQCIYKFRGARPDLMTTLHPDAEIIDLAENFRSGDAIVTAANDLIAHNGDSLAKPMVCATGRLGMVHALPGRSSDIVAEVATARKYDGYAWRDVAVLARNHKTLHRLSEKMAEHEIPHHVVGAGFEMTKTAEFQLVHAALRLCVNPRDDLAFMRLAAAFGLTDAQYAAVRACAAECSESHFWSYKWDDQSVGIHPLAELIRRYSRNEPGDEPDLGVSRWVNDICTVIDGHPGDRWIVVFWEHHCEGMTVKQALDWFALRDSQDDLPGDRDVVTLCTIHAAKGLEWPAVIVAECVDGTLPSSQAKREEHGVEEERRVAYVAFTRAKELLALHYRRPCDQAKDRKVQPPSRFLIESNALPNTTEQEAHT